eukprot:CAMPEP_0171548306 /NCGR_PEP_ID=MMETSP0960-20121227/5752_1 /TAXON_ID=87120 /ORGANISM="Aurantiochytrium limacinum, Strain ATCCMYA-1381" /LENGTH=327 /DNA_ID=CAMNT_0012096749 /DNA_START=107 /DNA_END=1087 /DNA_ORIENTATION=+
MARSKRRSTSANTQKLTKRVRLTDSTTVAVPCYQVTATYTTTVAHLRTAISVSNAKPERKYEFVYVEARKFTNIAFRMYVAVFESIDSEMEFSACRDLSPALQWVDTLETAVQSYAIECASHQSCKMPVFERSSRWESSIAKMMMNEGSVVWRPCDVSPMQLKVTKIDAIYNPIVERNFTAFLQNFTHLHHTTQTVKKKAPLRRNASVTTLYHGTQFVDPYYVALSNEGLDPRCSSDHNSFGRSICLSRAARYAAYGYGNVVGEEFSFLEVEVAIGNTFAATDLTRLKELTRAPRMPGKRCLYDSVSAKVPGFLDQGESFDPENARV